MKTHKNTITIQEACLQSARIVFNAMEMFIERVEKKGLLREEPTLILEPYNNGYIIKADYLAWDYRNDEAEEYMKLRTQLYIHPCTFFESYLEEGQAYLEYSLLTPTEEGYYNGRTEQTGDMTKLQTAAARWGNAISTELNNS